MPLHSASQTGVTGKTTAQMQDKATFSDATWSIEEDSTLPSTYLYPMLVTDTAGVTSWKIAKVTTSIKYTLSNVINNYIYNGTSQLPKEWLSSAIFGDTYSGWTLGTDYKLVHNATDVTGFKNAGTYENISVEVLKTGFVIDNTSKNGKFVIAPKEVEISTSKVYDGNVNFNSGFTVKTNDIISGDAVTVSGALATASKNVGNYTNFANNNLDLSNTNYKVEPPIPVAPLDKPIQQVIANIQQINSNTFTPANNSTRSNSLPTTRGNAVNNISPNTGATRQIQQSGNLELVEVDEALAGQLTGLSGNTGPLMPVFVIQGGINLDGLAAGSTNDEQ